MRETLRKFIESARFERTIIAVIVINAVVLGLETVPAIAGQYGLVLTLLDQIAITIFVIEIAMKLFVHRQQFFTVGWNVFDLAIVVAALVPASQGFAVLRAMRILRVLRLVSVVPRMRQVVQGLLSAIPSMGTVIVLLSLIFYIGAVMATKLFGTDFPDWFGSIPKSLYSLFQIMTLESWSMGIVRPVMEQFPYAWAFFVPFILITSFIVLNLFIAIIVNAMHEASDEEAGSEREEILRDLRLLRQQVEGLQK